MFFSFSFSSSFYNRAQAFSQSSTLVIGSDGNTIKLRESLKAPTTKRSPKLEINSNNDPLLIKFDSFQVFIIGFKRLVAGTTWPG